MNKLRELLGFTDAKYPSMSNTKAMIHRLINCALCSGFWIGLIVSWNLGYAAIIAVTAELINRKITNG